MTARGRANSRQTFRTAGNATAAAFSMVSRISAHPATGSSRLSDFRSSTENGLVSGCFAVGLSWGWFLPDRGPLPVGLLIGA